MEFSANNPVVKLCMQGMRLEDAGNYEDALALFLQAWEEATDDAEKFTSAYHIARRQTKPEDRLKWFNTGLQLARKINDDVVRPALPLLYAQLAQCYEELGEVDNAAKYNELAKQPTEAPSIKGPFFHGTRADLQIDDLLTAGGKSNYEADLIMNHIYFTALIHGAGLAAALAKGEGEERVYIVEPTGDFENDPNVTNKKFAGNPTRSYRSQKPLKVIGEIKNWARITLEERSKWQERLANNDGEIIN
ncbi:NAD(+)--rifampin ADP-ribosyltransferase [Sphingobacterium chuzhouense]|uniref:NAD(+)--rifampin ADP-ribosyltransferase n=1 Tax=Sphingobacterium chuzhouense TaxID=1742264 RepID=A0ABR7XTT9_9SPHI|nr:NAD(+)--rifampin ADP-ribosyltransferase [Sphingobacterium chuzhouense]MBD1422556.1 NAD(+)--rifampin ADP-ribosyltransferase [Sphingobacterium chuzhouense]